MKQEIKRDNYTIRFSEPTLYVDNKSRNRHFRKDGKGTRAGVAHRFARTGRN